MARDPHSAATRANQGWALLHAGDHRSDLEHFRQALRINPELDWAERGIVGALRVALAGVGTVVVTSPFMDPTSATAGAGRSLGPVFIVGLVGANLLANALAGARVRR